MMIIGIARARRTSYGQNSVHVTTSQLAASSYTDELAVWTSAFPHGDYYVCVIGVDPIKSRWMLTVRVNGETVAVRSGLIDPTSQVSRCYEWSNSAMKFTL
jgi:hypothetical protein